MRTLNDRLVAYAAFATFCILSSIRDVLSEVLFKHQSIDASPIFVLFVYCIVTQLAAGFCLFVTWISSEKFAMSIYSLKKELFLLNLFTLTAYAFYFVAIQSPLGAAVNSFVDYGTGPLFTAIVAAILIGEGLGKGFAWCATLSVLGLIVLGAPRLYSQEISLIWLFGLLFALLSSLSSSIYYVYFKILLRNNVTKCAIVFFRLFAITLLLGAILIVRPDLFRKDLLLETALIGFVGFSLPILVVLSIIQRVSINSFAMLLFLLPVLTFLISASIGYVQFYLSDIIAAGLTFLGVALYERWNSQKASE
jgi:drug/metabolite transporter (DMT)-like permease